MSKINLNILSDFAVVITLITALAFVLKLTIYP